MRVMQVAVDQVVHMVAMRHGGVPATRPMHVIGRVCSAGMPWRARVGVRRRDGNHVLIHVITVRVVQVAVMKIVDMSFMHDGHMSAVRSVLVIMVLMVLMVASCHGVLRWVEKRRLD
jgi:hypothetical protein